jgi:hypothetical protein
MNPERIVEGAEQQAEPAPVPARRPEGRAGHLTPEEKLQIRLAYLESGGPRTYKALAAEFGVNRDTVSACLKGPEFEALQKAFTEDVQRIAQQLLRSAAVEAADRRQSFTVAAEKGDHRPAKDLLLHTGVIEPVARHEDSGVVVLIGSGAVVNIGQALSAETEGPERE